MSRLLSKIPVIVLINLKFKLNFTGSTLVRTIISSAPIRIRKLTAKDAGKAIKFVQNEFKQNEPLIKGLNMEDKRLSSPLIEFVRNEIDQGMTYVAGQTRKSDFSNIFGMVINTRIVSWDPDLWNHFSACIKCKKTKDLITLWSFLFKDSNIFDKYKTNNFFNIAHVMVNEKNCKSFNAELNTHNMSCVLVDKSLKIARFRGFNYALMLCSGFNLSKVAEECGMTIIYDFPYRKLLNENLVPIVKTIQPNRNIKIYVKNILGG